MMMMTMVCGGGEIWPSAYVQVRGQACGFSLLLPLQIGIKLT